MDEAFTELTTTILAEMRRKEPLVLLVGIAGPPGSGKTTVAERVSDMLNATLAGEGTHRQAPAVMVSLDGFHLSRQQLLSLPNAEQAMLRRGAPWTFDILAIVDFVHNLQRNAEASLDRRTDMFAPSFDHAAKDPVLDDVIISKHSKIILLEHNYLLLDEDGWRDVAASLDLKVSVDVDPEVARQRVARRHVTAGIEPSLVAALERFDRNDGLNGDLIRKHLLKYDVCIQSVEMS